MPLPTRKSKCQDDHLLTLIHYSTPIGIKLRIDAVYLNSTMLTVRTKGCSQIATLLPSFNYSLRTRSGSAVNSECSLHALPSSCCLPTIFPLYG